MTLSQWLDKWLEEYVKGTIRESTLEGYRRDITNHVIPYLGEKPLRKVTAADLRSLYEKLLERGRKKGGNHEVGLSPTTVRSIHISTEARQKIMAAYDIYLDNYKQYADNEWYNDEKKTAVIDAWENTLTSTNYKVNDDIVLSVTFDGWHISDIGYYEENGWALTDISELKSIW